MACSLLAALRELHHVAGKRWASGLHLSLRFSIRVLYYAHCITHNTRHTMARQAYCYRIRCEALHKLGQVSKRIDSVTGEIVYYPVARLEDVIAGIARQCDQIGEYDVSPKMLRRMAMTDGLTKALMIRHYGIASRTADRYIHKLKTVQGWIEREYSWLAR